MICLLLATFATVIEIKVGTTTKVPDHDTHLSGWDRHGPALLIIALFAAAMIAGAMRGRAAGHGGPRRARRSSRC